MQTRIEAADQRFGWMLTTPGLLLLGAVIGFPVVWALFTSLFDYTLIMPNYETFVGFDNYRIAFEDKEFGHAAFVTLTFVAAIVVVEFSLGFLVALMLNSTERARGIYYLILLCPLLMNPVVVGLIWRMLLHPTLGIVNYLLGLVGIGPVNWLGDPTNAFITVVLVDVWHQVSFMIVLLLAGLSALPREPYEAARVEGATPLQSFWHITLPLMRPVIVVTLLIRVIFAIKTYDIIYIMTRGGPGDATDLISYFIYRRAFVGLNLGEACALAGILLAVIVLMTAYLHRVMRRV